MSKNKVDSPILDVLSHKPCGVKKMLRALRDTGLVVDTIHISPGGLTWFGQASTDMIELMDCDTLAVLPIKK